MLCHLLSKLRAERNAEHLLMSKREPSTIREFLRVANQEIRTNCPVKAENHRHDNQRHRRLRTKGRQCEQNQPESSRSLLDLNIASREYRSQLSPLVETDQNDICNEGNCHQQHDLPECLAADDCISCICCRLNCILSIIRVNDDCL